MRRYSPKRYSPKKRYRKKKSIFRSRFFWDFVLIFVLIFLIFYFLFFSEIFKIKEIKVSAPEVVLKKEIESFLRKKLGNNFFLVNSQNLENEILEKYPEIKTASLEKKFPASLVLEIEKRRLIGIFCSEKESEEEKENCFLIDGEGIIFESVIFGDSTSEDFGKDIITIFSEFEDKNLGEEAVSKEKIEQILKIDNELEKNLEIDVEKFILKGTKRLNVKTKEGWEIYFDLASDTNFALTKLRLLLEKEIPPEERKNLEYIDLRFSKVYYK